MSTFYPRIGEFDMKMLRRLGHGLALYLDDLLMLAGGGCFVRAAWEAWGRPAALAVAGVCLVAYAVAVREVQAAEVQAAVAAREARAVAADAHKTARSSAER